MFVSEAFELGARTAETKKLKRKILTGSANATAASVFKLSMYPRTTAAMETHRPINPKAIVCVSGIGASDNRVIKASTLRLRGTSSRPSSSSMAMGFPVKAVIAISLLSPLVTIGARGSFSMNFDGV